MNIEKIAQEITVELGYSGGQDEVLSVLNLGLSKLAEQAGEPVGYFYRDREGSWKEAHDPTLRHYHTPLYTEVQYLAAQQRTAEACAKAVFEQAKYFGYNVHAEAVRDAALNKWRKYYE